MYSILFQCVLYEWVDLKYTFVWFSTWKTTGQIWPIYETWQKNSFIWPVDINGQLQHHTAWPNKNAIILFGIIFQKIINKNEKLFRSNN